MATRVNLRLGQLILTVGLTLIVAGCSPPAGVEPMARIVIDGDRLSIEPSHLRSHQARFEVVGTADHLGYVTMGNARRVEPLSGQDMERLTRGDRQGFVFRMGLVGEGGAIDLSGLPPGTYAFILDREDAGPGTAPRAVAALTIDPG